MELATINEDNFEKEDDISRYAYFLSELIPEVSKRSKIPLTIMAEKIGRNKKYLSQVANAPSRIHSKKVVMFLTDAFLDPKFKVFLTGVELARLMEIKSKYNPFKDNEEYKDRLLKFIRNYYDPSIVLELLILMDCNYGVDQEILIERGQIYIDVANEMIESGFANFSNGFYTLYFNDIKWVSRDFLKTISDIIFKRVRKVSDTYNFMDTSVGWISEKDYHDIYKQMYKIRETISIAQIEAQETGEQEVPVAMLMMLTSLGSPVK